MSDQLKLWQSRFGDDYHMRNTVTDEHIKHRELMWMHMLNIISGDLPDDILEVGAGNGINIQAIRNIYKPQGKEVKIDAVEPNEKARINLLDGPATNIFVDTMMIEHKYNLVFTSGVLIHIHPDDLLKITKEIYRLSNKYIICAEYFRPEPETKKYHGEDNALFIRDFGGYWLDNFPLYCMSYGFFWKRLTGIDDITYWLFKKVH